MQNQKKAFITGITGQDGSYLAEFLLQKKYQVHGIIRRSSSFNTQRIDHIYQNPQIQNRNLFLYYSDLSDGSSLSRLIEKIQPHEIYNLAAQSHVGVSFDIPEYTADTGAIGTLRLLDAIKETGIQTRFYQASSSELFGKAQEIPQKESTPFYPKSPYACSKLFSYWITKNYRESYNLFSSNGILFNHESPRRGETFVTKKITLALAKIKLGLQNCLYLGNLDAKRDWGYALDFVKGMWQILQYHQPDDFVLATSETHSVREFVQEAAQCLGFKIAWKGHGPQEKGFDQSNGKLLVQVDQRYFRPSEVDILIGDYSKAKKYLNWEPTVKFKQLVQLLVDADLKLVQKMT